MEVGDRAMSSTKLSTRFMSRSFPVIAVMAICCWMGTGIVDAQEDEFEPINSSACADCHEASTHGSVFAEDITHSVHEGLECLDFHVDRDTFPHREL